MYQKRQLRLKLVSILTGYIYTGIDNVLCLDSSIFQEYIESLRSFPKARLQDLFLSKNIYAVIVRNHLFNYIPLEYASILFIEFEI